MNLSRDIHSLTDFKKRTPEFLKQLKDTGEPVVLTIDGKAELVVQDAASYQSKMMDIAEEAKVLEGIRRGLEDMAAGSIDHPSDLEIKSPRSTLHRSPLTPRAAWPSAKLGCAPPWLAAILVSLPARRPGIQPPGSQFINSPCGIVRLGPPLTKPPRLKVTIVPMRLGFPMSWRAISQAASPPC